MKLQLIEKNITKLQNDLDFWIKIKELWKRYEGEPLGEYPSAAYKAYLLTTGVTEAAKLLNENGMMFGKRKFQSTDISNAIHNLEIEDTDAMNLIRALHEIQSKKMMYKT